MKKQEAIAIRVSKDDIQEFLDAEKLIVKISKVAEIEDPLYPNLIKDGFTKTATVFKNKFKPPELHQRFWIGAFSTSAVQEILSDSTFRTYSRIYKWEIIS